MAARKKTTTAPETIADVKVEEQATTSVVEETTTPAVEEQAAPVAEQYTLLRKMNVRKKASLSAPVLKVLDKGTTVVVAEVKNDWLCLADGGFILYQGGKNARKAAD